MKLKQIIITLTLIFLTFNANANPAIEQKDQIKNKEVTENTINKGTLLLFINPAGRPCQMQDAIIQKNKKSILKNISLEYIKTTVINDRQKFYKYGIRGLPSLILLNKNDKVAKRFAPGIRESASIIAEINKLK